MPATVLHTSMKARALSRERTLAAPVNLPFFYPSIGVSLAPVGCFEVALAAPSRNEPKAQCAFELASTSTGLRSLMTFFPSRLLENFLSCRTDSCRQFAGRCFHLVIESAHPPIAHGRRHDTSRLASGP